MSEERPALESLSPHFINERSLLPPWPQDYEEAVFAMGCFWGAEKLFWQTDGVWVTMVGYSGGKDTAPNYKSVCAGHTGHTEAVRVIYDPRIVSYSELLQLFWEGHNPTQGMRQGHDIGTQYRSAIFTNTAEQIQLAQKTKERFQEQLATKGLGEITTQILTASEFYYAEDYHQQYLAKNDGAVCSIKGTGVSY